MKLIHHLENGKEKPPPDLSHLHFDDHINNEKEKRLIDTFRCLDIDEQKRIEQLIFHNLDHKKRE